MPRDERKIHTQALFRAVNQRIAELSAESEASADGALPSFICECPRIGCRDFVRAPLEVYNRVRNDPTLFIVLKGHEEPAVLPRAASASSAPADVRPSLLPSFLFPGQRVEVSCASGPRGLCTGAPGSRRTSRRLHATRFCVRRCGTRLG